jgi:MFS family permease
MTAIPHTALADGSRAYRRALWSSWLGTTIEFYDFALYTSMSSLILGPLFFSNLSPLTATIASLSTLAVGYIIRPLGAIAFGHFGDRIGRKRTLVYTLLIMGVATALIGVLPTSRQVGEAAPVLLVLLRLAGGFATGGEWGGAALIAFEHAPASKRGFAASTVNAGTPAGALLATGVLALFTLLPPDQFEAWGWRIPFLLSIVLLGVALWMRLQLAESPEFVQLAQSEQTKRVPLVSVLRHPLGAIITLLVSVGPFVFNYLVYSFGLVWSTQPGGVDRSQALLSLSIASFVNIPLALWFGALSDRISRKVVLSCAIVGGALYSMPFLYLLQLGSLLWTIVGFLGAVVFVAALFGPISSFISELFETKDRYTGASLGYQLASMIGGSAPAVFASLLLSGKGEAGIAISVVVIVLSAISLVATVLARSKAIEPTDDGLTLPTRVGLEVQD